ncbi:hypothetical protein EVAR_24613_1 [Eumeta japonica]|uniref:Uncharacterized protein n=1 Tax=Eumeta variegata TaxID=151549 RepID=A0A4C1V1Q3_EUMVA|nr:hypothetical protein EVAR_24613_1 [Eumeta japonica]
MITDELPDQLLSQNNLHAPCFGEHVKPPVPSRVKNSLALTLSGPSSYRCLHRPRSLPRQHGVCEMRTIEDCERAYLCTGSTLIRQLISTEKCEHNGDIFKMSMLT